jgi:hypothetical protein
MLEPHLAKQDPSGEALLQVLTDGLRIIPFAHLNNHFQIKLINNN